MKKWYMLLIVTVFLLTICGCSTVTDEAALSTDTGICEEIETTVPTLGNIEYWDIVHGEIVAMLNEYNLYVAAINSSYPCVLYAVEPGKRTDDGEVVAVGLSQTEYEELFQSAKKELHTILDQYKLAKPKTVFYACDSIVGICFQNWFIDENKVYNNLISRDVAIYKLELLEYYYEAKESAYIHADKLFDSVWAEHTVYTP